MNPRDTRPACRAGRRSNAAKSLLAIVWAVLACLLFGGRALAAGDLPELRLASGQDSVDAWPALRILADPDEVLDARAALDALNRFEPPTGPYGNIGPRAGAMWMHVRLAPEAGAPRSWTAHLDYALLRHVQVTVFAQDGQVVHAARLGASVAFADRALQTRALTTEMQLEPGRRYDMLLRIATPSAMLAPLKLMQPGALLVQESHEQAWQGAMSGLWLFMMVYSLVHYWVQRRQTMFLAYAGSLLCSWLFALCVYGHGAQYLWPNSAWLASNMSALAPLLLVFANANFFVSSLDMRQHAPRVAALLLGAGWLGLALAVLFLNGLASYRFTAMGATVLGAVHLMMVLPAAAQRLRAGDRAALYVLIGCALNIAGVVTFAALLRGYLPVNFLTMHGIQLSFAAEMACWLMVLGTRLEQLRAQAADASRQHAQLHALAYTDALTGVRNRRGLEMALEASLAGDCRHGDGDCRLAVFLIDMDGFKAINDRWGHETGDTLLRQVAQRLMDAVRPGDTVARLGGDEFVVAVTGLRVEDDAEAVGKKLLAQFAQAFDLGEGRLGQVGATVGYALAPRHGRDAATLMRRADTAMYFGKQIGKNTVVAFT